LKITFRLFNTFTWLEVDAEKPEDTRVPNDCFERDTDYYGNDINLNSDHENYGRGAGKRESVKDCQTLCQETKGCLVFTYKTGNKECWLKSTDNGRSNSAGDISGKKFCDSEGTQLHLETSLFLNAMLMKDFYII
jgi:hypothetical protein